MITTSIATAIVAGLFLTGPVAGQSPSELLQKGIYLQDTAGDLDAAIRTYRQILGSAPQRDVGAQAQYRLAEALLRKGDLTGAAQEFQNLARVYPDQQTLIRRLAGRLPTGMLHTSSPEMTERHRDLAFNGTRADERIATRWGFTLGAPNSLLKRGWTKETLKPGDAIEVYGFLAKATSDSPSGASRVLPGGRLLDEGTKHASARTIIFPGDRNILRHDPPAVADR